VLKLHILHRTHQVDFIIQYILVDNTIYFRAEYFSVPLASFSRKDMASETIAEDDDDDDDVVV